jgi:hypothetical protein
MRILRPEPIQQRLGVKASKFYADFVLRDAADPYLPGTTIPRLRLFSLTGRASGALEHDVDKLIEALSRQAFQPPVPVGQRSARR